MNYPQQLLNNQHASPEQAKPPLFMLGQVVATPGSLEVFQQHEDISIHQCLLNHQEGDWGELCSDDKQSNDNAVENGGRILSSYLVGEIKIWIITEADRSATTILLPSEY